MKAAASPSAIAHFGHRHDPDRSEIVYLCLDRYIRMDAKRDMLLSLDLRSESEVDDAIRALTHQLETAGKAAKAAIRRRRKGKGN